jgi:hypothetical protein
VPPTARLTSRKMTRVWFRLNGSPRTRRPNRPASSTSQVRRPEGCPRGCWSRARSFAAAGSWPSRDGPGTSSRGPACCSWCGSAGRRTGMDRAFHLQKTGINVMNHNFLVSFTTIIYAY